MISKILHTLGIKAKQAKKETRKSSHSFFQGIYEAYVLSTPDKY